jgi:hypothetical protein
MLDFLNSGFLVLVCLVRWIGGALAVMTAAGRRGYSSGQWLLAGLLFGPILAALFLIANPAERPEPDEAQAAAAIATCGDHPA